MSYEELIRYVREPETISTSDQRIIFEFKQKYPCFSLAQWLYLKSLQVSDSIYFDKEKNKTSLYASDRRKLYYFIYPENKKSEETENLRNESSGSYFDMLQKLETRDESKKSLSALAERLKSAREMMKVDTAESVIDEIPDKNQTAEIVAVNVVKQSVNFDDKENEAKKLIREKKYHGAIEILEALSLINPKKSVYFADQIRFLRKIIEN